MSTTAAYLSVSRPAQSQRAHFGIFIPNEADAHKNPDNKSETCRGTIIHAVGAPMAGFTHQYKRNFHPADLADLRKLVPLGTIELSVIWPPTYAQAVEESTARGELDRLALRVDPPRVSANSLAPVDDAKNRRYQGWTMDFIRHLVAKAVIEVEAVEIAQNERDPPDFGVGLRSVADRGGSPTVLRHELWCR